MLPDRVSNPGPLTYESGALPTALRGPAALNIKLRQQCKGNQPRFISVSGSHCLQHYKVNKIEASHALVALTAVGLEAHCILGTMSLITFLKKIHPWLSMYRKNSKYWDTQTSYHSCP